MNNKKTLPLKSLQLIRFFECTMVSRFPGPNIFDTFEKQFVIIFTLYKNYFSEQQR